MIFDWSVENKNSPNNIFYILLICLYIEWQNTIINTSRIILTEMDLHYRFRDLLALIKRSLHTQLIHITLFLLLLLVLFSSQKKSISSHHILAFNQQKSNLERKHLQTGHIPCLFSLKIALHKASPFLNLSQYYTKIFLCK